MIQPTAFDSSRKLRLAVLYRDDGYGRGVRDVTSSIIAEDSLPIEVVANVSYATTATTYQSQLISVKESNPDAVYIAGFTADTAEAIKEGIERRWTKIPVHRGRNMRRPTILYASGRNWSRPNLGIKNCNSMARTTAGTCPKSEHTLRTTSRHMMARFQEC